MVGSRRWRTWNIGAKTNGPIVFPVLFWQSVCPLVAQLIKRDGELLLLPLAVSAKRRDYMFRAQRMGLLSRGSVQREEWGESKIICVVIVFFARRKLICYSTFESLFRRILLISFQPRQNICHFAPSS